MKGAKMRKLVFVAFGFVCLFAFLISINMQQYVSQTPSTGLAVEKTFIPSSHLQDMAHERLEDWISQNKTALIFFYESGCDVCIAQISEIESLLEHVEKSSPNEFEDFRYFEYDFNTGLREKFNVTNHHTLILVKNGKEVMRTREALTKDELVGKIF